MAKSREGSNPSSPDPDFSVGSSMKLTNRLSLAFWWLGAGVTPVLIPNTEVKLGSGDGSHGHTWRE